MSARCTSKPFARPAVAVLGISDARTNPNAKIVGLKPFHWMIWADQSIGIVLAIGQQFSPVLPKRNRLQQSLHTSQRESAQMKTIQIDAPLGTLPGELSARWLRSQLPTDGQDVVLAVHSEGGAVLESLAMCDLIQSYNGKVTAIVSSMALSAASLVTSVCDRSVANQSIFNMHKSSD